MTTMRTFAWVITAALTFIPVEVQPIRADELAESRKTRLDAAMRILHEYVDKPDSFPRMSLRLFAVERAVNTLGEERELRAIELLGSSFYFQSPLGADKSGVSRVDRFPAAKALRSIGKPALPEVIRAGKSASSGVRQRLVAEVLIAILEYEEACNLLDKEIDRGKEPDRDSVQNLRQVRIELDSLNGDD